MLRYELSESFVIAFTQIRANKLRSILTALGVIIGIIAVTLMGTAISGIDSKVDSSFAVLGNDVIYVGKWPWGGGRGEWWVYRNRRNIKTEYAEQLKKIIDATPNSQLETAVPTTVTFRSVKSGDNQVNGVYTMGTTDEYAMITSADYKDGRFFTDAESRAGRNVCVIGYDIGDALFPNQSPVEKTVRISGQEFRVIGVIARQGSFLGLFSFDSQVIIPLTAFKKYFSASQNAEIRVKIKDKDRLVEARDELTGAMRRVRGILPDQKEDFAVNESQAFRSTIDPVKNGIALAGLFITGLSLFVGAIGIMNITFVSVKERTKEIGTRKALGARRRTILMQFLIEAVSICLIGGVFGTAIAFLMFLGISAAVPAFPVAFSGNLVVTAMLVSIITGVVSGFVPALSASKLDPVEA
ncbi:MAG: ABC transporter permease, partial [Rhizobacter sp.]|nr:ABC transporter permease [Chlorobiales bacterium]